MIRLVFRLILYFCALARLNQEVEAGWIDQDGDGDLDTCIQDTQPHCKSEWDPEQCEWVYGPGDQRPEDCLLKPGMWWDSTNCECKCDPTVTNETCCNGTPIPPNGAACCGGNIYWPPPNSQDCCGDANYGLVYYIDTIACCAPSLTYNKRQQQCCTTDEGEKKVFSWPGTGDGPGCCDGTYFTKGEREVVLNVDLGDKLSKVQAFLRSLGAIGLRYVPPKDARAYFEGKYAQKNTCCVVDTGYQVKVLHQFSVQGGTLDAGWAGGDGIPFLWGVIGFTGGFGGSASLIGGQLDELCTGWNACLGAKATITVSGGLYAGPSILRAKIQLYSEANGEFKYCLPAGWQGAICLEFGVEGSVWWRQSYKVWSGKQMLWKPCI
jgi:hypothetical protein